LVRLLERELADVAIHDPHVPTPTSSLADAVLDADAVIVATNHHEFCTPETLRAIVEGARRDAVVVDPWNCWGAAQVFAHADEVALLAGLTSR
jgi:UDP-N-acetyl-D-mannosaminuronic acid dehydrogenase